MTRAWPALVAPRVAALPWVSDLIGCTTPPLLARAMSGPEDRAPKICMKVAHGSLQSSLCTSAQWCRYDKAMASARRPNGIDLLVRCIGEVALEPLEDWNESAIEERMAPMSWTSASSMARRMSSPMTPASPRPPPAKARSPISTAMGELLYRGYPIEQLAEKSNHLEVCYLLLNGELPTARTAGRFHPARDAPHDGA
jgi:hypothetical protein